MNNTYSYDDVYNVRSVTNSSAYSPKALTSQYVKHEYFYDDLNRLDSAYGQFNTSSPNVYANYSLSMGYDELYNVTRKNQTLNKAGVQFDGKLLSGYDLCYSYGGNHQQIRSIADTSYRTENLIVKTGKQQSYRYV